MGPRSETEPINSLDPEDLNEILNYCQISNISHTKSQHVNGVSSCIVFVESVEARW